MSKPPCPFDSCCATIPCMSAQPGRLIFIFITLLVTLILCVGSSTAQTGDVATLTTPDTTDFPHLSAYLDIHDPSGRFIYGLTPQEVVIQENGVPVQVSELDEQRVGVQFVIAITPGSSFTIRDSLGNSRYDYLLRGLLAGGWVSEPSGGDDYSLITLGGPQLTHSSSPVSLHSSLEAYKPNDPNAIPSLEVLASALQVAGDPTTRPGMERAILFITSPQETDVSLGLQSIIASANQENIHIFVWLVAAPEVFDLPQIDLLRNLAEQTHAAFFAFSHDETVPDLDTLLEPLRHVYQLKYDSKVATSGPQQVDAQLNIGTELITTPVQSFEIDLQPPVATILNPPTEIIRSFSNQPTPITSNVEVDLLPVEQVISIQVAFPDGHDRTITTTRLYVDGAVVAENTQPPYDQFVWDLHPYITDGEHTLSVEAIDDLGLLGTSVESKVKITVPSGSHGLMVAVTQKRPLIIGVTVVVSASILVLVLIVGGRIRPKPHPGQVWPPAGSTDKTRPAGYRERMQQRKDPVTQPVQIASSSNKKVKTRSINWKAFIPWLTRKEKPIPALAYLMPLVGSDEPTLPAAMQINNQDVILGSDAHQATLVIVDRSVDAVHARIQHADKTFLITDAGSGAGTWVNYERVSSQGTTLEHMDIIHLGRIGFRFKLSEPGALRKIVVTPLEPEP